MSGELLEILSCIDTPQDLQLFINNQTLSYIEMTKLLDDICSFYQYNRPEMLSIIDA